ncbi:MAG: PAS domain S-box protein [Chloroflexi bacterium]|nr:PAS domain S-box protein [Chloroflexota bacterium]
MIDNMIDHRQLLEHYKQELRIVEARFRNLVTRNEDGIVVVSGDGRVRFLNPAAEALLGQTADSLPGLPFGFPLIPNTTAQFQINGLSQKMVEVRTTATEWDNEAAIMICLREVTAPQPVSVADDFLLEQQLHLQSAVLEAAANAIMITDRESKVVWVNPAFTRLTGYTLDEMRGQTPRLLRSNQHNQPFYKMLWDTILSGQVWQGEVVNKRKDGGLYVEEQTITPVLNEQGEVTHFISIKQDVTERKRREREQGAIIEIVTTLRAARTRAEMLTIIVDEVIALIGGTSAMFVFSSSETGEVELGRGEWASLTGEKLALGDIARRVAASGRFYVDNGLLDDLRRSFPGLFDLPAIACVPLIAHEQMIGALWLGRQTAFTEVEAGSFVAIADMSANALYRASLHEQTERRLHNLTALRVVEQATNSSFDLRVNLTIFLEQTTSQLGADAANVLLMSPNSPVLKYATGRGFLSPASQRGEVTLNNSLAGRVVLERRPISYPDLNLVQHLERERLWLKEGFAAYYGVPLVAKGEVKGVLEIFHRAPLKLDAERLDFLEALATQAAVAIDNAQLFESLQQSNLELALAYNATIEGWSRAMDLRDRETEGHTQRVTEVTVKLARSIGLGETDIVHIRRGALLHDMGKMGIPDSILFKPGPLTIEERDIMRRHTVYAYEMLSPIAYLRPALDIPYCHHERWDGQGYPRQLKGEQIPLAARLFAVADVWDALSSDRPYRQAWRQEQVHEYITRQTGKHFDPDVVKVFLRSASL